MKLTRGSTVAIAFAVALPAAAAAGVVAHASAATKTINVTEREYHITVSGKGAAGSVKFVVKNTGKLTHALEISGPGVKAKKTPLIKPGKTATLTVTLKAGSYTLWCPIPGHAALGMKAAFKVAGGSGGSGTEGGSAPPPAPTTTSTTTTTSGGGGGEAWS
ncbi:MAG TPA: plastocyanin/azurin family copper-binding protein [Gaiellaceae bacterium]|nr:plastocyanin/azurin family copper-binding protein [Gaiellaceae bacterium]